MTKRNVLTLAQKMVIVNFLQLQEQGTVTASHIVETLKQEVDVQPRRMAHASAREAVLAQAIIDLADSSETPLRTDLLRDVRRIAAQQSLPAQVNDSPSSR